MDCREAIRRAIDLVQHNDVKTYWADAGKVPQYAIAQPGDPAWAGGTIYEDKRICMVNASKEKVWEVISHIGGSTGWYHGTGLWVLRGFIDRLVGGVGSGRGRRNAVEISVGDVLDFWRVVSVEKNDHLRLAAEMRLPGIGLLNFEIKAIDDNHCELLQQARFKPHGLTGICYWYVLIPLHEYIFGGMIKKIANRAERV